MSNKKNDRRVLRSKKLIRAALTDLILEIGLENITVSKLANKATINRGTFYLHYKDIHELLAKCEEEVLQKIINIRNSALHHHEEANLIQPSKEIILQFSTKLCEFLRKNADFLKAILGPNGDPSFQVKLKKVLEEAMLLKQEEQIKIKDDLVLPNDYLSAYISSAHIGIISHWLEDGASIQPKDIALAITELTFNGPATYSKIVIDSSSEKENKEKSE